MSGENAEIKRLYISVVSPVYGCVGCLEGLVERVGDAIRQMGCDYEIILVDDASPDGAWSRIVQLSESYPQVRGIRLSRNFGQHAAISAGLRSVRGDVVVVMDCDLQDVPEEIPNLVGELDDEVQIVLAQRVERQDGWGKRLGSMVFYAILRWLTDSDYDHTVANFGAYRRRVINVINDMPETDRFFPLLVRWTGFRRHYLPVRHARRTEGRSSYSFGKLIRLAMNVALSYSDKPLRLVVKAAAMFALFAMAMTLYSVYRYESGDIRVAGFTSIVASIWLVGSVVVFCTGIVGLYLGRLYNQVKGRPAYIVAEETGENK